jgi:hypothetical protein
VLNCHLQFFSSSQFRGVATLANHSQTGINQIWLQDTDESRKKLRMLLYFFWLHARRTYCVNMAISEKSIPQNLPTLVHFCMRFLCISCTGFFWLSNDENLPPKK